MEGVASVLVGTLASAVGMDVVARGGDAAWRPFLVGNGLVVVVGSGAQLVAYWYVPAAEVAAMSGLVTVWSLAIAAAVHERRVALRSWLAACVVVGGSAVVALSAPPLPASGAREFRPPTATLVVGLAVAAVVLDERFVDRGPVWGAVGAGAVGGFTDTMAKAWEFSGGDARWGLTALAFAATQLGVLNVALRRHGAGAVVPAYMTSLMVCVVVVCGSAFGEFATASADRLAAFVLGAAAAAAGSFVLARDGAAAAAAAPAPPGLRGVSTAPAAGAG